MQPVSQVRSRPSQNREEEEPQGGSSCRPIPVLVVEVVENPNWLPYQRRGNASLRRAKSTLTRRFPGRQATGNRVLALKSNRCYAESRYIAPWRESPW